MSKRKSISHYHNIVSDLNTLISDNKLTKKPTDANYYNYYNNPINCNKITLVDNHIYFDSIVDDDSINKLIEYINIINSIANKINFADNSPILNNNIDYEKFKIIYLHINSKGGYLKSLLPLLNIKKTYNIEIVSVVEKECVDCGILLASLCDYRIVKKSAVCKLTKYSVNSSLNSSVNIPYYWNYFKQCNNDVNEINNFNSDLYHLFCNIIDSKLVNEKLQIYFQKNNVWTSKKYKKLGLADEIL